MKTAVIAAAAHHAFWSSTLALGLVAGVCALIVGVAVAVIISRGPRREGVRTRVGEFVKPIEAAGAATSGAGALTSRMLSRTERSLERKHWWDDFKEKLEIARIERPAIEIVYLTAAGSLIAAALVFALTRNVIPAAFGLVAGPLLARALIERQLRRQRLLFAEHLPSHLQELASAMRAGHSIVSGMAVVVEGAREPTRRELQRVIADEQLGMPLQEALGAVAGRMGTRDMEQVALVADLHRRTGGNMAEVLDRVAEAVRERSELNRELRTLTTQARMSRWIVTSLPPVLLLVIYIVNKAYVEVLFKTGSGQLLLGLAAGMVIAGSIVMARVVRIEV
jgi:tight adherence protein B